VIYYIIQENIYIFIKRLHHSFCKNIVGMFLTITTKNHIAMISDGFYKQLFRIKKTG